MLDALELVWAEGTGGGTSMKPQKRVLHNIHSPRKPSRAGRFGKFPRRNLIQSDQFREARLMSGLSRDRAAELLGVSIRTIGHWETGKVRVSYAAFKLLRVYRHGDLIDPRWSEYRLSRGLLCTPEGHEIHPGEIRWFSLMIQRAKLAAVIAKERDALRNELSDVKKAIAAAGGEGLGLVYYKTSGTPIREPLVYQGFRANQVLAIGANVVPNWHHGNHRQAKPGTAQPAIASGSQSPAPGLCGCDGHTAEHCGHHGAAQLPAVRHGETSAGCRKSEAAAQGQAGQACKGGSLAVSGSEAAAKGWPERSLPLWQRSQGQAMPSGNDLTGGVL